MIVNKYINGGGGGTGSQGPIGPQGPQGIEGVGVQGAEGAQGPIGADGAQGPQGFEGVQGPQGTEGIQGIEGAQGPQGQNGIDQAPVILKASTSAPSGLSVGDVYAVKTETNVGEWVEFYESAVPSEYHSKKVKVCIDQEGTYLFHYDSNQNWLGLTYTGGSFEIYGYLTPDGQDKWAFDTDAVAQGYIEYNTDGNTSWLEATITDDVYYWSMLDAYGLGSCRYAYVETEGPSICDVYQVEASGATKLAKITDIPSGGSQGGGYVVLDSLSGTGEDGVIYECDEKLFMWTNESGSVAQWTTVDTGETAFTQYNGYGLIFSNIPSDTKLFEFKYPYGGDYRYVYMSGNTLVLTETGGSIVSTCDVGETAQFGTSQYGEMYYVRINYQKHYIGFYFEGYIETQNKWDGTVSGGHFVMFDETNYPYPTDNNQSGIPRWNSKGQIVGKANNIETKFVKINTTGYASNINIYYASENSTPSEWFFPTQCGNAGQILTSTGDGEPQWSNWIKAVKITSDAYEALQTKDPNTLYLIDDE